MKFFIKNICLAVFAILVLSACTMHKNIPYMKDAESISKEDFTKAARSYEATIMAKDVLSITVNTPTGAASKDFNLSIVPQNASEVVQTAINPTTGTSGTLQNYIVDNGGYIDFPVLGRLKIAGLTKSQAQKMIYDKIYPRYLKEEPIVNIRFLSYKVTVLGEVVKPGVYTTDNEQITILDALALAGDLTIFGNRKNVLLVREDDNGVRSTRRINLQNNELLLNNDIYYLRQNDKIYVQPNKTRGNSSGIGAVESLALSGLSLLISIIAIVIR